MRYVDGQRTPRAGFRGSLRGYRYEEGDDSLPFVDIMEVTLVPR